MRSYRFQAFDSLEDLRAVEEPTPQPQRGELLLRIMAVALNHRDVALVTGGFQRKARVGLVPTSDAAAVVEAIGEGVTGWSVGDRVIGAYHPRWYGGVMPRDVTAEDYGSGRDGWLTEHKVVSQEAVVRIPDTLSFEQASTLPCAALTAWSALCGPNPIRPGQLVLTQGTGGVSLFAIQLARVLGARVIATTAGEARLALLDRLGVEATVDYRADERWGESARTLSGGEGVDRVIEVGGPATFGQSLEAVAPGGEIASIGYLTKDNPGLDFFALRNSGASVRPIFNGSRSDLGDLVRVVTAGGVVPVIDRIFPFTETGAAFAHLQSGGPVGKVVIRIGD